METTPTKQKKAATRTTVPIRISGSDIDLYKWDRVHHPRFGDGTTVAVTPKGRAVINFDGIGERQLVLSLSPLVRYLRPKKSADDRVQVAFVHQGRQVETRVCKRDGAEKLGKQMVENYAPVFNGRYVISELKPASKVVPIQKGKPKVAVRPSAQYPKRPRHKVKVTHYFTIVT